jgi:hypothetical protein
MGQTLYGARLIQSKGNGPSLRYDAIGKSSEVFAQNDIVQLNSLSGSAGELKVGSAVVAGSMLVGVIAKADTMTATNTTVAKVYPAFIPIYDDQIWLMGCNSDLSNNHTDAGTYYNITGGTGAQQVDVSGSVSTTTLRCVEIVKVDPYNEGGTGAGSGLRKCMVRILKTPYTNITAT